MPPKSRQDQPHAGPVIRSEEEYSGALRRLAQLERVALGTPETEGLQDLIEAILDYEQNHAPGSGFAGKLH